jgi:hypothetical protein
VSSNKKCHRCLIAPQTLVMQVILYGISGPSAGARSAVSCSQRSCEGESIAGPSAGARPGVISCRATGCCCVSFAAGTFLCSLCLFLLMMESPLRCYYLVRIPHSTPIRSRAVEARTERGKIFLSLQRACLAAAYIRGCDASHISACLLPSSLLCIRRSPSLLTSSCAASTVTTGCS